MVGSRRSRRVGALVLVFGVVCGTVGALQGSASAQGQAGELDGSSGALGSTKIDGDDTGSRDNDPKVPCAFSVDYFDFPAHHVGTVTVESQGFSKLAGTPLIAAPVVTTLTAPGAAGLNNSVAVDLAPGVAAVAADNEGRYLAKITVEVSNGAASVYSKFKVVKVTGCSQSGGDPTPECSGASSVSATTATVGATVTGTATSVTFTLAGAANSPVTDTAAPYEATFTGLTASTAYTYSVEAAPGGDSDNDATRCRFTTAAAGGGGGGGQTASVSCTGPSKLGHDKATVGASMSNGAPSSVTFKLSNGKTATDANGADGWSAEFTGLTADTAYTYTADFAPQNMTATGDLCALRTMAQSAAPSDPPVVLPGGEERPPVVTPRVPTEIGTPATQERPAATPAVPAATAATTAAPAAAPASPASSATGATPPRVLGVQISRPAPTALARTGVDSAALVPAGVSLVILGALLLLPTRRRRTA